MCLAHSVYLRFRTSRPKPTLEYYCCQSEVRSRGIHGSIQQKAILVLPVGFKTSESIHIQHRQNWIAPIRVRFSCASSKYSNTSPTPFPQYFVLVIFICLIPKQGFDSINPLIVKAILKVGDFTHSAHSRSIRVSSVVADASGGYAVDEMPVPTPICRLV